MYPPIHFEAISHEQIRDYADASHDFNSIHLDSAFAQQAGLPDVIAHGMLSMGLASRALEVWGFELSEMKSFNAKFKEKVFVGEALIAEFLEETKLENSRKIQWKLKKAPDIDVLLAEAVFA